MTQDKIHMHIYDTYLAFLESLFFQEPKSFKSIISGASWLGESPKTAWVTSFPPGRFDLGRFNPLLLPPSLGEGNSRPF